MRAEKAPVAGNREVALLSDVYAVAIRWGLCEINPCTGVRRNKERPRTRAISDQEFRAFRATVAQPIQAAMDLALLTGQRLGDVLAMRWSHCTEQGIEVRQGKTGKALVVRWSPELLDVVEQCKSTMKARAVTPIDPPLVGIVRSAFDTAWQRAQVAWAESGRSRFTFHDIRAMSNDRHETGDHLGNTPATRAKHYERRAKVVTPVSFK